MGFTYGKFIGKIKFPELLNDDNVYNGLTNAFWLIFQNESNWNYRRFSKNGYVPKEYNYNSDEELVLQNQLNYSEIDIEIVKTSRYWPEDSEKEDGKSNSDVMFCCTNWDMACKDPFLFGLNVSINYNSDKFRLHRWNDFYQASTIKTPINDNEVFKSDFYYYEIEWKPNEIIWRIGPSLDKMKVMGYTNSNYTVIPDNQMIVAVTQEFHYSDWWPPVVWNQNDIPFPKSDIEGKIFEIVVE